MSTSVTVFLAFGVTLSAEEAQDLEPQGADPVRCDPCPHPADEGEAATRHAYYVAASVRPVLETRNGPEYPAAVLDLDALRAQCLRYQDEWRGALREYVTAVVDDFDRATAIRTRVDRAGWMLVVSDG